MMLQNIDAYRRNKAIYERRKQGESRKAIADDLGISVYRVSQDASRWKTVLMIQEMIKTNSFEGHPGWRETCNELVDAGLLDSPITITFQKRSPEYGYA